MCEKVEYQCPECGTQLVAPETFVDYGCPNDDDCDESLIPHKDAEPLKHGCDVCDEEFDSEHSMKTHRGKQHEQCEECGEWFRDERSLASHKGQVH